MAPRIVDGELVRLRCRSCGAAVSHLVLSGDTDMATEGLGTAASCSGDRVALGEITGEELAAADAGRVSFERRLQAELGDPNLRAVVFLRAEGQTGVEPSESFRLFRSRYRPPVLIYRCPCCEVGEAEGIASMSVAEFRDRGGEILIHGNLQI